MRRITRRKVLIGIGIYVVAAVLSASFIGDTRLTGRRGLAPTFLVVAMLGLLGYGVYRFRVRPRSEASEMDASTLRLRHSSKDRFGLRDLPFGMLTRLNPPWMVGNVMWGRWEGIEVTVFDVWGGGRQFGAPQQEGPGHEFRCVVMPFPVPWPPIIVERERLATRVADMVGLQDIALESEAFNRAFEVRCADARFANAILDGTMIEWLLSLELDWGFEARDGSLLSYTPLQGLVEPAPALVTARGFLEHLPTVAYSLFPVSPQPVPAPPPAR